MKEVVVIIRKSPFNTIRNSEALRMSVGLTLEDNKVTVVFLGESVYLLLENEPELINSGIIHKHIETLQLLKHRLITEKEALDGLNKPQIRYKCIENANQSQLTAIITAADVVIVY